jgi:hypothetical protein
MEALLGFAASPLLIGLYVGLTAWFAWTVLRDTQFRTPILVTIAVSVVTIGGLLMVLGKWMLIVPGLASYGLGLVIASVVYVGLYRFSEGRWPLWRKRKRSRPSDGPLGSAPRPRS